MLLVEDLGEVEGAIGVHLDEVDAIGGSGGDKRLDGGGGVAAPGRDVVANDEFLGEAWAGD